MITAATDQLERAERFLGTIPGAATRALSRALNVSIRDARREALAKITARYEVNEADVEARLSIILARPSSLAATLRALSPSLPLHYFPHAPAAPGTGGPGRAPLTATVKRGEPKPVRSAFIARLGVKPRIVLRTGEQTRTGRDRLRVLFSVPIAEMLGVPNVRLAVEERALEVLDERLGREIDRELEAAT